MEAHHQTSGMLEFCAKRGVDGLGRVASVAQVAVEYTTFLEPDVRVAGVRQQPVHLGLEPSSKDVPRMVGSVGQKRVGRAGITVDLARQVCRSKRAGGADAGQIWLG